MTEYPALQAAFREARATIIAGTGVSISCSDGAKTASWIGMLEKSVDWVVENIPDVTNSWTELVRNTIQNAKDESNTDVLLGAASLITKKINAEGEQARYNWLAELIGSLGPSAPEWATAIDGLKCPILTTNYDTLIEQVTGRDSAVWTDPMGLQSVISRQSTAVGHLHGLWCKPETLVLTEAEYERVLSSDPLQALQQAASSVTSLVYVGVGSGLEDPNFSQLLSWHRQRFVPSGVPHFRLCRESEVAELRLIHGADNINVVSYGTSFSDLPSFLSQFHPEESSLEIIQNRPERGRDLLASKAREVSILCENLDDLEDRSVGELLAPPVILPMSMEQFRAAKSSDPTGEQEQFQRLDPLHVSRHPGITVIAGPDGSGRTMAMYWLLENAAKPSLGATPIVVESSDLHRGGRPLIKALRNRIRETGPPIPKEDPFPSMIIGIDDLSPYQGKLFQHTVDDLSQFKEMQVFITCQEGFEAELTKQLREAGLESEIRYIGEFGRPDIRKLVAITGPQRSRNIEDNIVSILKQQHLPRTPFTISLLASVLTAGIAVAANSSHTTLLDLYLNQLIGRGDIAEDSRWGMDSDLRSAVLSDLAEFYVEQGYNSLPEAKLVDRIASFFSARGIPESATNLLLELRSRRVLIQEGGSVRFAHSSYLYLFAAKSATKNQELRDKLLTSPLLYAPVLKHYPSLERADSDFLVSLEKSFETLCKTIETTPAFHARVRAIDPPADLQERLERANKSSMDDDEITKSDEKQETHVEDDLELFPRNEDEVALFDPPDDLPAFHKLTISLDLTSTALRDSVLIADPVMKSRILKRLLNGWGKLACLFNDDDAMMESLRQTIVAIVEGLNIDEQKRRVFSELLIEFAPALFVASGISSTLSTTRLLAALNDVIDDDSPADANTALGAALLILDIESDDWVRLLERTTEGHKDSKVVAGYIKLSCMEKYGNGEHSIRNEQRLRRYISDLECRRLSFKTDRERQHYRDIFERQVLPSRGNKNRPARISSSSNV